jgi:phenylpyruvate tautomerase PptA (4-oxalocrotonate tautomerase family)
MVKLQLINADIIDDTDIVTSRFFRKRKKKTCVRIKRVKSDSYLTYGQSCKTYMELSVDTAPPPNVVTGRCVDKGSPDR